MNISGRQVSLYAISGTSRVYFVNHTTKTGKSKTGIMIEKEPSMVKMDGFSFVGCAENRLLKKKGEML